MSAGRPPPASVRGLLRLAGVGPGGDATDRDLIRAFALDRSEAAFAALMARHGPMVRAVCRRALRDHHLADDAVQAVFVVLARRAGSVRWNESLAGWLFEVARRVSRKAAAQAARRATREARAADAPEPAAPQPPLPAADLSALQAALDEELARLPERLRLPVVLCHLEGLSHETVAKQLGITDGQLRGRLYRAKLKLQDRLTRRGFTLTAVLLALAVAPPAGALPPVLAAGTLRLAVGSDAAVPPTVLALTHGVTPAMFTLTTKTLAAVTVFGALGLGAGGWAAKSAVADDPAAPAPTAKAPDAPPAPAAKKDDKPAGPKEKVETVHGVIRTVDPTAIKAKPPELGKDIAGLGTRLDGFGSIVVKPDDNDQPELTVPLAPGAPLTFHGKPIKPADLKAGMHVELDFRGNTTDLLAVRAGWPPTKAVVKAVDVAKRTVTIPLRTEGDTEFDVPIPVAPGAAVVIDGLPAGLADLPATGPAELALSLDKKSIVRIESAGDLADLPGVVTSTRQEQVKSEGTAAALPSWRYGIAIEVHVRPHRPGAEEQPVELLFDVAPNAKVRLNGREARFQDLVPAAHPRVRLGFGPDAKTVVRILAADALPKPKDDDGKEDD